MNPKGSKIDLRGHTAAMFDVFNTLLFPEDWPFLVALADFHGTDPGVLNNALKKLKPEAETGKMTAGERISRVAASLDHPISDRKAREFADLELAEMVAGSVVYPGAREALELFAGHLKTELVSNAHPNSRRMVIALGLTKFVDRGYFSCDRDVRARKPDEGIYRAVLSGLAVDPHQCVYFGDGGDHELEPPRAQGMMVVWVRSPNQCAEGIPDCDYVVDGVDELRKLCVF